MTLPSLRNFCSVSVFDRSAIQIQCALWSRCIWYMSWCIPATPSTADGVACSLRHRIAPWILYPKCRYGIPCTSWVEVSSKAHIFWRYVPSEIYQHCSPHRFYLPDCNRSSPDALASVLDGIPESFLDSSLPILGAAAWIQAFVVVSSYPLISFHGLPSNGHWRVACYEVLNNVRSVAHHACGAKCRHHNPRKNALLARHLQLYLAVVRWTLRSTLAALGG